MHCDIKSNHDSVEYSVCAFHHTQGRIFSTIQGYFNGWYCNNDESFLSDSQVVGVEKDGQKLDVR